MDAGRRRQPAFQLARPGDLLDVRLELRAAFRAVQQGQEGQILNRAPVMPGHQRRLFRRAGKDPEAVLVHFGREQLVQPGAFDPVGQETLPLQFAQELLHVAARGDDDNDRPQARPACPPAGASNKGSRQYG